MICPRIILIFTPRQRCYVKVVCVCLFRVGMEVPCDQVIHWTSLYRPPPADMASHCTRTTLALALIPLPPDIEPRCTRTPSPSLLVISGGHHWRPVQSCLVQNPCPTGAYIWWLLKHVQSVQAGGINPAGMLSF